MKTKYTYMVFSLIGLVGGSCHGACPMPGAGSGGKRSQVGSGRVMGTNTDANRALLYWAEAGSLAGVKQALAAGANIQTVDSDGFTPLLKVAHHGNRGNIEYEEIAKLLLSYGADVNATDRNGLTALMEAAVKGQKSLVDLLLNVPGINVDATNGYRSTALMLVVERAGADDVVAPQIVHSLLVHGADKDKVDSWNRSVLDLAVKPNDSMPERNDEIINMLEKWETMGG